MLLSILSDDDVIMAVPSRFFLVRFSGRSNFCFGPGRSSKCSCKQLHNVAMVLHNSAQADHNKLTLGMLPGDSVCLNLQQHGHLKAAQTPESSTDDRAACTAGICCL